GAQWGGAATGPDGILYVPAKEIPVYTSLVKKVEQSENLSFGAKSYLQNCSSCHGQDKMGNHDGSYPALANIGKRLSKSEINKVLLGGKGMMPAFSHLSAMEREAIINFLEGRTEATEVYNNSKKS